MLRSSCIIRLLGRSSLCSSAASAATETSVESATKKALVTLRKRTGYSYFNCHKALLKFGPDRLNEAEEWLKQFAAKEGWAKAAKLSNRVTKHGLVSALVDADVAAVLEVNCETDFVSRSPDFVRLVEEISKSALLAAKKILKPEKSVGKFKFIISDVHSLCHNDESIRENIVKGVGTLGENIVLSNVHLFTSNPQVVLAACAHPNERTDSVNIGRFASVVGLQRKVKEGFPLDIIGKQICQHVIGMRCESLGTPDEESVKTKKLEALKRENESSDDEFNEYCPEEVTLIDESETRLLRQAFMLNPRQTVYDYVSGHGVEIIDFVRIGVDNDFICGGDK